MAVEYQFIIVFLLGFFLGRTLKLYFMGIGAKVMFKMLDGDEKKKVKKTFQEKIDEMKKQQEEINKN